MSAASASPPVEAVAVPGGHLSTTTHGEGPPLVLCHGGPGLSDNLAPLAALADDHATVHRYDQRGAPGSTQSGPFDVATAISDLEHLRQHWGHDRWIVGGHSWGANLALLYALAHPARTSAVLYVSGLGCAWGWQAETRRHRLARLGPGERRELEALEARVAAGDPSATPMMLRLFWTTDFASRATADRVLSGGPLYPHPRNDEVAATLSASHRAALDVGIEDGIASLNAPVLCIHGTADANPSRARRVAELARHGRWAPIDAAGHSPWLEQPDHVRAVLVPFLNAMS